MDVINNRWLKVPLVGFRGLWRAATRNRDVGVKIRIEASPDPSEGGEKD